MRTETAAVTPAADPQRGCGPALTDGDIGAAIRARRQDCGLLLETAATRSGINVSVLSRIERGERPCRVAEMVGIAEALDTTSDGMLQLTRKIQASHKADTAKANNSDALAGQP